MKRPAIVRGMHGLGDNLHQRAVLRQLMVEHDVWLESSWVAPYHDLIADGLKVIHKATSLRTQAKNAKRERRRFEQSRAPIGARRFDVWYRPADVRRCGSVLGAMMKSVGGDLDQADFRLPIPEAWRAQAATWLRRWRPTKPIMIYRPLVERTEWGGCAARNPDADAYADLFREIRDQFFVVSIADLVRGKEWISGRQVEADAICHYGELEFEALAALTSIAGLVFCSPGFAVILAQSVGTPAICTFGGYENSSSFSAGARFAPYLGIDPIEPCDCFSHDHACQKQIDLAAARSKVRAFAAKAAARAATGL